MEATGCPETSVRNLHSTLRKIPKERRSHLYRGGNLKSLIYRSVQHSKTLHYSHTQFYVRFSSKQRLLS